MDKRILVIILCIILLAIVLFPKPYSNTTSSDCHQFADIEIKKGYCIGMIWNMESQEPGIPGDQIIDSCTVTKNGSYCLGYAVIEEKTKAT